MAALTARWHGERARAAGIRDADAWAAAVASADQAREPHGRALTRLRSAEVLAPDDATRPRAAELLREAFVLADELGAAPLTSAVERLARRARIALHPDAGAAGPRAAALRLGLSEREVDVLALLALGQTDRELARTLFITERTAGHHVSHILAKLGVARRGEAAAVAHRLGLVGLDDGRDQGLGAGDA